MSSNSSRKPGVRSHYTTHSDDSARSAGFSVAKFKSDEGSISSQWRERRARSEAAASRGSGSARIPEIGDPSKTATGYIPIPSVSDPKPHGSQASSSYRRPDISVMSVGPVPPSAGQAPARRRVRKGEGRDIARKQLDAASSEIAGERRPRPAQRPSSPRPARGGSRPAPRRPRDDRRRERSAASRLMEPIGGALSGATGVLGRLSPKSFALISLAVVVACLALMVYPAAREYYISTRSLASANAELAQVDERNAKVQEMIDGLSSDAGVEDYVRAQYGWVKDGESSGTVIGVESSATDRSLPTDVPEGRVAAEDSLANEILDAIFFVDDDEYGRRPFG